MESNIFQKSENNGAERKENVFADFLVNKGLYDEIEITGDNTPELADLIDGCVKISVYCSECREKRVFVSNSIEYSYYSGGVWNSGFLAPEIRANNISFINPNDTPFTSIPKEAYRVIVFKFVCAMDNEHHLDYIVLINGNIMKKIGQSPSVADLSYPEINEYQKVMSEEDARALRKAIGLFANGIGAGSYVYLRRIYERIIDEEGKKAISDGKIDSDEFKNATEANRVKMLSNYLPNLIKENTAFYGIVSKGIHELSEKECLSYFPVMKLFIEIVFREREKERKEKIEKDNLCKALNKINGEIKNTQKE